MYYTLHVQTMILPVPAPPCSCGNPLPFRVHDGPLSLELQDAPINPLPRVRLRRSPELRFRRGEKLKIINHELPPTLLPPQQAALCHGIAKSTRDTAAGGMAVHLHYPHTDR